MAHVSSNISIIYIYIYTVFQKKLHPFYFCNNFVDPGPIWIIFGRYVANEFSLDYKVLGIMQD